MLKPSHLALSVLLVLSASCSAAQDDGAENQSASVTRAGSTDPLQHLNVIAAADMEGRGTGTPGHLRAAEYVASECRTAGLAGAFPTSDTPYFQPFTAGSFVAPTSEEPKHEAFGSELFENGLYVDGHASAETLREMGTQLCAAWTAADQTCPLDSVEGADPRPFARAPAKTQNVVAILPGSGAHRDQIVLLSAHLDHLGKSGATIYYGADDNGSGSSSLLAIMHRLVSEQRSLDRTVAFLWTSGEERGLLGAAFFADNPPATIPLAKIKQVVNLDMVGRWDDTRLSIGTDGKPATDASATAIEAANQGLERPFAKINRDIQSYASRQDGYAFSRKGVPSLFVFEGLSKPTGGGSLIPQYHKPTDTIEALMTDNGGSKLRRIVDLAVLGVAKLANE